MNVKKIIEVIVGAAVIIIAGYYGWQYWQKKQAAEEPLPTYLSDEATQALEAARNPVKNVAETNPFKEKETNPLLNKYKNPFE